MGETTMYKIELNPSADPMERMSDANFAIRTANDSRGLQSNDVMGFYTCASCSDPVRFRTTPTKIAGDIIEQLPKDIRAMIGNMGCEVSFRHVVDNEVFLNTELMLDWAKKSFGIIGQRLVLGPTDMDIIQDVMTGGRLLEWAGTHKVPLAIFCGYRFLFEEDAFEEIRKYSKEIPFAMCHNPYDLPYEEISHAIRSTGAEVWTGAGFHEGLLNGTMQKAEKFGFKGVLTTKAAWEKGVLNKYD